MSILYIQEHLACHNYSKDKSEGFGYFEVPKKTKSTEETSKNTFLFILEGSVKITCNTTHQTLLTKQTMIFYPAKSIVKLHFLSHTKLIKACLGNIKEICEIYTLQELRGHKQSEYQFNPLHIHCEIFLFLGLLKKSLLDKINCIFFHNLKLREMLFLFRYYYSKEELANFLYPIIGTSYQFKDLVLSHIDKATTVKKLAYLCNFSISAFKQKFKEEFNESPGEWIKKYRLNRIRYKISNINLPFKIIADDLGFPSISQFSKFCKRHTGLTPTELRARTIQKEHYFFQEKSDYKKLK